MNMNMNTKNAKIGYEVEIGYYTFDFGSERWDALQFATIAKANIDDKATVIRIVTRILEDNEQKCDNELKTESEDI